MKKNNTKELSLKEIEILEFITEHMNVKGYFPSISDISEGVSLSSGSGIHRYLGLLEEKGFLHRDNSKNRSLKAYDHADIYFVPVLSKKDIIKNNKVSDRSNYIPVSIKNLGSKPLFIYKNDLNYEKLNIFKNDLLIIKEYDKSYGFELSDIFLVESSQDIFLKSVEEFNKKDYNIKGILTGLIRKF